MKEVKETCESVKARNSSNAGLWTRQSCDANTVLHTLRNSPLRELPLTCSTRAASHTSAPRTFFINQGFLLSVEAALVT